MRNSKYKAFSDQSPMLRRISLTGGWPTEALTLANRPSYARRSGLCEGGITSAPRDVRGYGSWGPRACPWGSTVS
jgi:hypothetical protein